VQIDELAEKLKMGPARVELKNLKDERLIAALKAAAAGFIGTMASGLQAEGAELPVVLRRAVTSRPVLESQSIVQAGR
jgi:CO/xanthine dehydrogenase Mo-binding subunit